MNEEFIKEISILILNSMSLPLLLFDDKLNIIFLNKAFKTVCLIDRNSLIGKNIFSCHKNLRSTELGKVEILKLKDYKEDKSMLSKMELKINERTFHVFLSPIRDKKSGFIGGLLIMMDVTTEKDLEKLKAQTFSTVAHDIKNPLIAMVGFASLLLRGKKGNVTQDQARFLGIIKKEGEKAIRLADNFLTSVKIDFNKVGYYYERIDTEKWIQEIIKKMEPTFEAKNLDIIFEAEKAIPEIMIDPLQMERAIENLLSNAVKFTKEGGKIWLNLNRAEKGDGIEIKIKDNGIGIDQEFLPHIFELYKRGIERIEGTGLGLFVTRSIVEGHGGKIKVESKKGEGSCFTIYLPFFKNNPF